jgi:erythromycin esterase
MGLSRLGRAGSAAALLLSAALGASCSSPRPAAQKLPMALLSARPRRVKPPPRAATSLVGVVLGADGNPMDFALVAAVNVTDDPEAGKLPLLATSKDRGKFEFPELPPGNYGLTAMGPAANGIKPAAGTAGATASGVFAGVVTVTPDEAGPPMLIRLGTQGIQLTGHVVDEKGAALPEALVRAVRESPFEGDHFFAKTNAQGLFSLAVPAGRYFVVGQAAGRRAVKIDFAIDPEHIPPDMELRLPPELTPPPRADMAAWIASGGGTLEAADAKSDGDLAPLQGIARDARIFAFGEASYTGSELASLRLRVFRYLVEKMDFSMLLFEAGQADVRALDDYVLHGKAKLPELLVHLGYFSLDTEESTALFEWMRAYNDVPAHKKKLRVAGFDVQRTITAAQNVQSYLTKVDLALASTVETTLDRLRVNDFGAQYRTRPGEEQDAVKSDLESLQQRFDKNARVYSAKAGKVAYAQARNDVLALLWATRVYRDERLRGAAMADLARREIEAQPAGTKVMLWAHDSQVSRRKADGGMGAALEEVYKSDYVALGSTFYQGWISAWDFTTGPTMERGTKLFRLGAAESGSLESLLDAAGVSLFIADVRRAPPSLAAWFEAPLSMRNLGTSFVAERRSRTRTIVKEAFDGLVFVKKQTTARFTATGRRPGRAEWQE